MERTNAQQAWLLFAIALMGLMINVDYTAVNLSLVTISYHLHSDLNTIQWALSGYMLAWAAFIIPAGKQVDLIGQKRMCLIGIGLFLFGSALAGISNNSILFIIARILQGISGAIYVPTLYALIFKHFPKHKLGFAMGLLSVGIGFGMAIGPTLGGVVLNYMGWRWIFFINIPIALTALVLIARFADPDQINTTTSKPDHIGSTILAISITLLMYGLSKISVLGASSTEFITMMMVSLLLFISLIGWQYKSNREPTIPFHLFLNKQYTAVVIATFLEQYAFSASLILIALFLQKVLGISVLKASFMFLALNLLFGIVSPFGGSIVDRVGIKWPAFVGLVLLGIGLMGFSQLTIGGSSSFIYLWLIVTGLGMGVAFAALNSGMLKTVDAKESGVASSIFLLFVLLGNTCGVVISSMIYEKTAIMTLSNKLFNINLSVQQDAQLRDVVHYIGGQTHNLSAFPIMLQNKIMSLIPYSLNTGITNALLVTAVGVFIASILIVCFTKSERRSKLNEEKHVRT